MTIADILWRLLDRIDELERNSPKTDEEKSKEKEN